MNQSSEYPSSPSAWPKLLCDTHAHTIASTHAFSTVHDYWAAAKQQQLQLFAITDHGSRMPDSPHDWHFGNMKILPRLQDNIALLRGIEANILPNNEGVDIPERMVDFLDIAIASFHEPVFAPNNSRINTQAAIAAFKTGAIQIFGHPGNPNFPVDYDELIRAAKDLNIAIEINNSSFTYSREGSKPHCLKILELVDKHDWKVVFASDSHSAFHLGKFDECLSAAQEVGFPYQRVLTATPARLLNFLGEHNKKVAVELKDWVMGLNG